MTSIPLPLLRSLVLCLAGAAAACAAGGEESEPGLKQRAAEGLKRAVAFFRSEVAVHGTYLWQYSEDLSKREGEGKATATQGWVQPPGTPAVGMAFLDAHEAAGEAAFLDAALETARGLARGQLRSGGWGYFIDFDPNGSRPLAYRMSEPARPRARNVTTLDDNTTQAALRFLMRMDRALGFKDEQVRDAVRYALERLLKAQFPNGAWPQGFDSFPEPDRYPVKKASYPEGWPREYPGGEYWRFYTFNDNALADTIEVMLEASRIYKQAPAEAGMAVLADSCRQAADKAGSFILLAQLPEPQPAWAQQYNLEMHPAWARKFEPPSVTGGESQGVLQILLGLYRSTADPRYLEPIPRALEYLRRSRLPDGRLARFYELRTNRPLYFTKDYRLTYEDTDLPTHYAFKVSDRTDSIAREFEAIRQLDAAALAKARESSKPKVTQALLNEVRAILAAQDARGRWVEEGQLRSFGPEDKTSRVIRSSTFIRNVETLSRYLAATR